MHPEQLAHRRQQILFEILACPRCLEPCKVVASHLVERAVVEGTVCCAACGTVGIVQRYRPNFLITDFSEGEIPIGVVAEEIDGSLTSCTLEGTWHSVDRGLLGDGLGSRISGTVEGVGVALEVLMHHWSGQVRFQCGATHRTLQLYASAPTRLMVVLDGLQQGRHEWSATVVDGRVPESLGDQLVIREVLVLVSAERAAPDHFAPVNRGNPYPGGFTTILDRLPADAVVLDLGGGDRQHPDPRVQTLEYLPYRAADLSADAHQLPIRTASIDAILCQAVLEHVRDPAGVVREMRRVLKPGGTVFSDFAFMQPLHAAPFHFFNITPHGANLLFQDWIILRSGATGGLAETVGWFFRLLDAGQRLGQTRADRIICDLAELDSALTDDELASVASVVFIEAQRPTE